MLTVTDAEAGLDLSRFLVRRLGLSLEEARERTTRGGVQVDRHRMLRSDLLLQAGQRLHVFEDQAASEPPCAPRLTIAFKDPDLAVLCKPPGLVTVASRRGEATTAEAQLIELLGTEARLLHRLDRDTSGLLLASLHGGQCRRCLAQDLAGRRIRRLYLALVRGTPQAPEVRVRGRLALEHGHARGSSDPRAREAESLVRLLARRGALSLLQVELLTGRTHQARAHLCELGLPILGDERYGGPPAPRLALHAHALRFTHPVTGRSLEVHWPLPEALRQIWQESGP